MTRHYLETSAAAAWLLDEAGAQDVCSVLADSAGVVTSRLTLLELRRVLVQAPLLRALDPAVLRAARDLLPELVAHLEVIPLHEPLLKRAARPFPIEPVRALDAIHLATVATLCEQGDEVVVLTLDRRVRANAEALGIEVGPGG